MPAHMFDIGLLILGEALMGLTLGLCVHFIFAGIQTGGEVLGFQMGFSMVALADPLTGARISATSHLLYMVSMMMFLALDGHLFLLSALADSFRIVPIGGLSYNAPLVSTVLSLSADMFILAIKIAAPIMAALFLVELALALMGRAAPQMNLLTMGFPLKIAVGFFFLSMIFTLMSTKMEDLITDLHPMFIHLMQMGR
jgi:Flagellar biosynthesis pathway, component FliR